ncbi:aspartate-semialdehyde dehydrogenase [candidate division WOR-3 bacterium]|mgnify:CR=1 FL=1|uniref:Aspartate-semialdehyde dehydrogenase n=1 Tax=candidate division WOR-3 bacterium TaxID=2052148 RepID=A0A660SHI8_UNCW3|nr:MAG: aspartate-semialdehyde dehydrogenase [candidate division WOR-3 bacterium]
MRIAVVGASGLVGREIFEVLFHREFPAQEIFAYSTRRSVGEKIRFGYDQIEVEELKLEEMGEFDFIFSALDRESAKELVPRLKEKGVVIDNSSAFRLDPDVPLVVPEVNPDRAKEHKGIIANPNCSTIQLVVAIGPIHKEFGIESLHIATYQSVSGWGREALDQFNYEVEFVAVGEPPDSKGSVFPRPIGANLIPKIGEFGDDGLSEEERKLQLETNKILESEIKVFPFCVRVPVRIGHGEAVWLRLKKSASRDEIIRLLESSPGVVVDRDYSTPIEIAGKDEVHVGRITETEEGVFLWIVADNLRKGAATNAVQIAEILKES